MSAPGISLFRMSVLASVALLQSAPAFAQMPADPSWPDYVHRLRHAPAVRMVRARDIETVAESEPNDSPPSADVAALGIRATGVVNPAGDVDAWSLDLVAGTLLSADVDAAVAGSPLDAVLGLIAPDGVTLLAVNDDFDGADSRISFRIPVSGRYYVVVRGFGKTGAPELTYAINFGTVTCTGTGTELEPNDSPGAATPIAIGASGSGEICLTSDGPAGDVDFWAFTAQAGKTLELDVDAAGLGQVVDPFLALYASDGTTQLAFNDDTDGPDSRLQFSIIATGTYYVAVSTPANPANPFRYTLGIRAITPGPGDPITVRAQALGRPLGLAAGTNGDLFVGDLVGNRVLRVTGPGTVTTFAAGILIPLGIAFDAFGHLLVASSDNVVYRISPQGQATRFITDAGFPFWIAVAPDGRIWLTDVSDRSLRRYSRTGRFEARFDATEVGGSGPGPLAIGPSGEPFFSTGTGIWKLANGRPQLVVSDAPVIGAFAFDVAGNIYAATPTTGRIMLFDMDGRVLADPFAIGPDAPQTVAFGRDGTGATTTRLFAADPRIGRVIEMNPAGVVHRGLPVGQVPATFTLDAAVAGLLGAGGLNAVEVQFLDALGNHNGRYDVGDFQSYLRSVGDLPGAAATTSARRLGNDR